MCQTALFLLKAMCFTLSAQSSVEEVSLENKLEPIQYFLNLDKEVVASIESTFTNLEKDHCKYIETKNKSGGLLSRNAYRDQGKFLGYPRDYRKKPSLQEINDVRFIILTLANKSVLSIAKDKELIENAGDRIDHLHPLNFLEVVFTDDELKVGLKNIRQKGWLWSTFIDGLVATIKTEKSIGNISMPMLTSFANSISIRVEDLIPFFMEEKWERMIDYLILNVARSDEGNRYDF